MKIIKNKEAIGKTFTSYKNIAVINSKLPLVNGQVNHKFHIFSDVYDLVGMPYETTIKHIAELCSYLACNSVGLTKKTIDDNKLFKEQKRSMLAINFSELSGNRKFEHDFIQRSLVNLDVDNKLDNTVNIQSIEAKLDDLGVEYILYSTVSHHEALPCFRIIADIGKQCNEVDFMAATQYIADKLGLSIDGPLDDKSFINSQIMYLPCAHRHINPIVIYKSGNNLLEIDDGNLSDYIDSYEPVIKITKNFPKNTTKKHINHPDRSTDLFLKHCNIRQEILIHDNITSSTHQMYRDDLDNNPGLFIYHDQKVVRDTSHNKNYSLFYSQNDFSEAVQHQLPAHSDITQELLEWETDKINNYGLLLGNTGFGKSVALGQLTEIDPKHKKRIFTFHTRDLRDTFYANHPDNCDLILGNGELILEGIGYDYKRIKNINKFLECHYKKLFDNANATPKSGINSNITDFGFHEYLLAKSSNNRHHGTSLDALLKKGLIDSNEKDKIKKLVKNNLNKMKNNKHFVMTTAKLELLVTFSNNDEYEDFVIYTDETRVGMLTSIPKGTIFNDIYGREVVIKDNDPLDYGKLVKLKRCLVTVESSIQKELDHQQIPYKLISEPSKTYDPNLEILIVKSTSNMKTIDNNGNLKEDGPDLHDSEDDNNPKTTIRKAIYNAIKAPHGGKVNIIANGLIKEGCTTNLVNNKGRNDLDLHDLIIIMSCATPEEIAKTMFCCGISCPYEANELIMSDKTTQAIGRNQGYRNREGNRDGEPSTGDNKCLLITPDHYSLDIHNVTTMVTEVNQWVNKQSKNVISEENRDKFYFREVIESVCNATVSSNQTPILTMQDKNTITVNLHGLFAKHEIHVHGNKIPMKALKEQIVPDGIDIEKNEFEAIVAKSCSIATTRYYGSGNNKKVCAIYQGNNSQTTTIN